MSAALVVSLCACATLPPAPKLPVAPGVPQAALPSVASRVLGVQVRCASDMNDSMALMLDVVFVYDAKLLAKLPTTGPAWFAHRQQLLLKYAGFVEVLKLELTVSDDTGVLNLSKQQRSAERVLIFANYLAATGQARVDVSVFECPKLLAMAGGLMISEGPRRRKWSPMFGRWASANNSWRVNNDVRCIH